MEKLTVKRAKEYLVEWVYLRSVAKVAETDEHYYLQGKKSDGLRVDIKVERNLNADSKDFNIYERTVLDDHWEWLDAIPAEEE